MINNEILKEIGLSNNEVEVYLITLKLNEALAGQIAKQSKISRPHIYDNLNKLVEKGLVTYTMKGSKKYFKTTKPSKLLEYLKEKEKNLIGIMPELKKLHDSAEEKLKIEIYEGSEGLKIILNDIIKTGKEVFTFGASDRVRQYLPDFFIDRYLIEREKKRIIAKQLFSDKTKVLKTKMSVFRKLPKSFASPSTTVIYGNKVTIWIWTKNPTIIMIENLGVAKSYKEYFELLWKTAKP